MQKVWCDGDWGGDELLILAVFRAHKDKFNVLGLSSVFGNAPINHTTQNGLNISHMLSPDEHIKFYKGAAKASNGAELEGDGAWAEDGIGDVTIPTSPHDIEEEDAVSAMLQMLQDNEDSTVTITATGPLTNIAEAYRRHPGITKRAKEIVIMGACTKEIPAADMKTRQGNITPYAEFNLQQAPEDAKTVLESDLPITLLPMNCTQNLYVSDSFKETLRAGLGEHGHSELAETIINIITAPEDFDRLKFAKPSFMHDVNTALWLLCTILDVDQYSGRWGFVHIESRDDIYPIDDEKNSVNSETGKREYTTSGRSVFTHDPDGNVFVADAIKEPEALINEVAQSLIDVCRHIPPPAPKAGMEPHL